MDNIKYRFIQNVGDYFPSGYFGEDFLEKVQKCAGLSNDEIKALCSPFVRLQHDYDEYKNFIINQNPRVEDAIKKTHDFNTQLLKILGYDTDHAYQEHCIVNEDSEPVEMIPVRHILHQGQQVKMFVMEMQNLIAIDDREPAGLFEQQYESEPDRNTKQQKYAARQWRFVFELDKEKYKISPAIINKAITQIFLLPEERRPHFILMMAGNVVFLFDKDKWAKGSYLQFSLDELFAQTRIPAFRNYFALFHMLVSKQTLAAEGEMVLMDTIIEESYKNAYEVTKDLKEGVILAVETLANEALYYMKNVVNRPFGKYNKETGVYDETDDDFEAEVKDDCLTIIYRLLFLFYAESRDELEILPVGDEVYKRGYSLESLRDLEMVRLNSQESRNGYFFDDSIRHLFNLLSDGHNATLSGFYKSFRVRPIDSPLFNNKNLNHLADVRIRNIKWQEIIKALSLSKKKNYCGRISYANLGVNQLGSVYESLLAYRGFYAEEDYIEVHKASKPEEGTFLVPYSRMGDFEDNEILKKNNEISENDNEQIALIPKGTFVYRLNGRDRQKSASYYTPEVLTRSTVKYTLKSIIDDVAANKRKATDLLELKILEPAMGAAAFQNEVINQLAEAYLTHQQRQQRERGLKNWRIQPDHYRDELQRVKAFIATKNVYGVDLNPTAIELGKLSLWLNVIHKDMDTPFFGHRITLGNAVIGAWFKVYSEKEYYDNPKSYSKKLKNKLIPWWEHAPHKVNFNAKRKRVGRLETEIYHFLLPDKAMLATAGIKDIKEKAKAEKLAYENAKIARENDSSIDLPSLQTYNNLQRMKKIMDDWTKPITYEDAKTLRRLSDKIDKLIVEFVQYQIKVDKLTANNFSVWGKPAESAKDYTIEGYAEKLKLLETRNSQENAHHKLKIIMDYWCSLWFWTPEDAGCLPTRQEYWEDINRILNVELPPQDVQTVRTKIRSSRIVNGMEDMFAPKEYVIDFDEEATDMAKEEDIETEEVEIVEDKALSQEDANKIFAENSGKSQLFTGPRTPVVERLSKQYHFFHPMLEFIEVFWLRDGFDVICGNPPWLKLEFDEQGILSEKYPEVAIRKVSAPDARKMRDKMFVQIPTTEQLYRSEEIETVCSSSFMNAYCNYPLLVGQQTNLYKCVLENGFSLLSNNGFMGLLHPETVYDDPKGQPLRKEIYKRLRYHFQYTNELTLFAEVDHHTKYGEQIYGSHRDVIDFLSIHNLFHPSTVDSCFVHDGHGLCGGIKDDNGKWNTNAHRDRIVRFTEQELRVLSEAFEDGADWESVKLTSIHANVIVSVLEKLSEFPNHVRDFEHIVTRNVEGTAAEDRGEVTQGVIEVSDINELIISGPHFFVANPLNKNPRLKYMTSSDYDNIDLSKIKKDFIPRSLFNAIKGAPYLRNIDKGFFVCQDENGQDIFDNWVDYNKLGFRKMVGSTSERTLTGALIPAKVSHVDTVHSITFKNQSFTVELAGLTCSIPLDFYLKTLGAINVHYGIIDSFPLGVVKKYKPALFSRTLLLNCLTTAYAELWQEMWDGTYKNETWSKDDSRLKPFSELHEDWSWDIPLRNYFERRQALVEIDVISAMALGLSLQDLEMIYTIQFPVLQQNENDTWYDAEGKIVFTCSKGLTGVGVDRKYNSKIGMLGWEDIRGEQIDENTYAGTAPTHTHTIDPAKSELYGGQQQTFVAPYNRCDRIADYRTAWAHFEKVFNNE